MTRDTDELARRTIELAEATRDLGRQVDGAVDRILGDAARRTAVELEYLADSLREVAEETTGPTHRGCGRRHQPFTPCPRAEVDA